jgi:hypothetical protein
MLVTASQQIPFLEKLRRRNTLVERQFGFLQRIFTPRSVFLHFGAHDCALALKAATYVERVYAVDVAEGLTSGLRLPCNLRFVDSRDLSAIGKGTVDVTFSERLSAARLREVHKCLAPDGVHAFQASEEPWMLRELMRAAGFSTIRTHFLANLLHQPRLLTAHK